MFRDIRSYDDYTTVRASPEALFFFLGLNFFLLGLLIVIFPALLRILVAAFLFVNAAFFLVLAWRLWRLKRSVSREAKIFWDF